MSEPSMMHPAQDQALSDDEREYARSLSGLLARELAGHADGFEGYALDTLGVPWPVVIRLLIHGHKHRLAMTVAHYLAQMTTNDSDAKGAAMNLCDQLLSMIIVQLSNSRESLHKAKTKHAQDPSQ